MKIIMMTMITSENPGSFPPSHWDLWHKREACHCAQVTTKFFVPRKKTGPKKEEKIYSFKSFHIEWPISFQRHQDQEHPGEKRRQLCNCRLWPCCQVPFHFSLSLSYIAIALSLSTCLKPMRFTSFHFHILSLSHSFTFTRFDSETNEIDIAPNTRVGTRRYMAPEVRDNDNKMMINRQQKHVEII